jgi:hypothetical protein
VNFDVDSHALWVYAHILLFVYWLGADVGLFAVMAFVKDARSSFETRATLIRMAFYIDLFPRVSFALILPVGLHLARNLGLYPVDTAMLVAVWIISMAWAAGHIAIVAWKRRPFTRRLLQINKFYEAGAGAVFIGLGTWSLATGEPIAADWFAVKLLLFGSIFWVVLGIDTVFQPFTTILRMGPTGSTPAAERRITQMTNGTMAWAVVLYLLIAVVAFLGVVKPSW